MDLYAKSQQLLETLANSIHDRSPKGSEPFFFTTVECYKTEAWIKELMEEIKKELGSI